jgi:hypothetical protein
MTRNEVHASRHVTIRRSRFTHCGERSPECVNCLMLFRRSRHVTVEDSWFHDCYGCDFIHGRFGSILHDSPKPLRALPTVPLPAPPPTGV